jgi:hypothetical protein
MIDALMTNAQIFLNKIYRLERQMEEFLFRSQVEACVVQWSV